MQQYVVSVDIVTSSSVTKSDMTALLGAQPSDSGQKEDGALWWSYGSSLDQTQAYESVPDQHKGLSDNVISVASAIRPRHPFRVAEDIKAISLNIGVTFDTYTVTVRLPIQAIDVLKSKIPEFGIWIDYHPMPDSDSLHPAPDDVGEAAT
jgi:hypothetical protein